MKVLIKETEEIKGWSKFDYIYGDEGEEVKLEEGILNLLLESFKRYNAITIWYSGASPKEIEDFLEKSHFNDISQILFVPDRKHHHLALYLSRALGAGNEPNQLFFPDGSILLTVPKYKF